MLCIAGSLVRSLARSSLSSSHGVRDLSTVSHVTIPLRQAVGTQREGKKDGHIREMISRTSDTGLAGMQEESNPHRPSLEFRWSAARRLGAVQSAEGK
jgi:hypothetical protein